MKRIMFLLLLGLFAFPTYSFSKETDTLDLSIQGDYDGTQDFKNFLQQNPEVELPKSGVEYHIRIVEPDPDIDYKILNVEIDSDIDYKLRIIDPENGAENAFDGGELAEELLRKYKKRDNADSK